MNVAIVVDNIARALNGLAGRRVAVLGLAFKPNTDDGRELASLHVCRDLARAGASVRAFDPVASAQAAAALSDVASAVTYFCAGRERAGALKAVGV
jgi:UDPglucose 6-dehydrogenase